MERKLGYEDMKVGQSIGTIEFTTNKEDLEDFIDLVQWEKENMPADAKFLPPSFGVSGNVRLLHKYVGGPGGGVWAKSEHKYFNKPEKGKTLIKTGEIADKYVKRGRKYIVWETETRDEDGRLIYRSKETSVWSMEE